MHYSVRPRNKQYIDAGMLLGWRNYVSTLIISKRVAMVMLGKKHELLHWYSVYTHSILILFIYKSGFNLNTTTNCMIICISEIRQHVNVSHCLFFRCKSSATFLSWMYELIIRGIVQMNIFIVKECSKMLVEKFRSPVSENFVGLCSSWQ